MKPVDPWLLLFADATAVFAYWHDPVAFLWQCLVVTLVVTNSTLVLYCAAALESTPHREER